MITVESSIIQDRATTSATGERLKGGRRPGVISRRTIVNKRQVVSIEFVVARQHYARRFEESTMSQGMSAA